MVHLDHFSQCKQELNEQSKYPYLMPRFDFGKNGGGAS